MKHLLAVLTAVFTAAVLAVPGTSLAVDTYLPGFRTAYPAATGSRVDSCSLCHSSVPSRNTYGAAWRTAGRNYAAIDGADSDGDGFTNGDEIAAFTFPGDAADHPTAADTTPPTMNTFLIPATATSLTVGITALAASDDVAVTGYLLNESAAPPLPTAAGWTLSAPTTYTFAAEGAHTLYAWAKDAAGNVSTSLSDSVTITLPTGPDTTPPTVLVFSIPAAAASLTVNVLGFAASDNVGVSGYLLSESDVAPAPTATGWTASAPTRYTFAVPGAHTLYAWAKDAAGNVSTSLSASVEITLPIIPDPLLVSNFTNATAVGDPDWDKIVGAFGGIRGTFVALGPARNVALADNAIAGLAPFGGGRIEAKVRLINPLPATRAEVIFDYTNGRSYRYVRLDNATQRLFIGQVGMVGGQPALRPSSVRLPQVFTRLNLWHRLRIDIDPVAGSVTVFVDRFATPVLRKRFWETGVGRVGLAASAGQRKVAFDKVSIWDATILP